MAKPLKISRILTILEAFRGSMTSEEVAMSLGLRANDKLEGRRIRHIVADLANAGYLVASRSAVPTDRRRVRYALTPWGETFMLGHRQKAPAFAPFPTEALDQAPPEVRVDPVPGEPGILAGFAPLRRFDKPSGAPRGEDQPGAVIPFPKGEVRRMPPPPAKGTVPAYPKSPVITNVTSEAPKGFTPPTAPATPRTVTFDKPRVVTDVGGMPLGHVTPGEPVKLIQPAPVVEAPAEIPKLKELTRNADEIPVTVRLAVLEDRMVRVTDQLELIVRQMNAMQDSFVAIAAGINLGLQKAA